MNKYVLPQPDKHGNYYFGKSSKEPPMIFISLVTPGKYFVLKAESGIVFDGPAPKLFSSPQEALVFLNT